MNVKKNELDIWENEMYSSQDLYRDHSWFFTEAKITNITLVDMRKYTDTLSFGM